MVRTNYSQYYYTMFNKRFKQKYKDAKAERENSNLPDKTYYKDYYDKWLLEEKNTIIEEKKVEAERKKFEKKEREKQRKKVNDKPAAEVISGENDDLVVILDYDAGGSRVVRIKGSVRIYRISKTL
jgi:hypothetical protein